ncbi:hypothetical protein D3C81_424750 [compost metagenome]
MIGTVLNAGSFFLDIAKQLYPESADIGAAAKVTDRAKHSYNVVSTTSVHRSAARAILTPMVVIDKGLLHQEYMQDLIQIITLRDIVATLTHLALISPAGVGVRVENLIGSISPNRGGLMSMLAGLEALDTNLRPVISVTGNEAAVPGAPDPKNTASTEDKVTVGGKTYTDLMEYTPLAVGKVVNATIYTEGDKPREIPLTFRQIPVPAGADDLRKMFLAAKTEDGLKMRWLMRRTGEITNPEWFNGTDIVKARFKAKTGDSTGYYQEAMKRDTKNMLEAVRTGVLSMNSMANSIVLGSDEATQLEFTMGRKFSDPTSRQKIFESLSANTIVICNDDRGVFTFYTDGQSMPEVYTRRDLAVKSKKEGSTNTLADLVKLLNGGM